MSSKEEIENNRIPQEIVEILGIKKEDEDSLIAFKQSLFEQTARENIKLKKQIDQLETNNQKLIEKLEETRNNLENDGYVGYADEIQEILEIVKE